MSYSNFKDLIKIILPHFCFCRLDVVDLYFKKEFIQVKRLVGIVSYFCLIFCMVLEMTIVDDPFCLRALFDIISQWVNISSESEALRQTYSENILEWLAKYFFLKKLFKTSVRKLFFLTYQGRFLQDLVKKFSDYLYLRAHLDEYFYFHLLVDKYMRSQNLVLWNLRRLLERVVTQQNAQINFFIKAFLSCSDLLKQMPSIGFQQNPFQKRTNFGY